MIHFRMANRDDSQALLDWRNHPETRKFSLSPEKIPADEHELWFNNKLHANDCRLLIVTFNNDRAGMIRLDHSANDIIASWNIAPEKRGMGIGQAMLEKLTGQSADILMAKILPANIPSLKIAKQAGFRATDSDSNSLIYHYYPPTMEHQVLGLREHMALYNQSVPGQYRFHYFE